MPSVGVEEHNGGAEERGRQQRLVLGLRWVDELSLRPVSVVISGEFHAHLMQ
jgi:hypothetical protein